MSRQPAGSDVFDAATRSAVMRAVRGRDTGPELKVRRLLWRLGGRYRLNVRALPGSPDIVLASRRLAIFVHGCFWHGHDCARGARVPKTNRPYWEAKVARNRARDDRTSAALLKEGWRVAVIWECETRDPSALEARLSQILSATPPLSRSAQRRSGNLDAGAD